MLFFLFFSLGFASGWVFPRTQKTTTSTLTRENSLDYKFIRPVLYLQVPEDDSSPELQSLKKTVSAYIKNAISQNSASDISVYFRELDTNEWTGVNTDDKYSPASMLKVVSLIAFLRASENNPDLLSEKVYLDAPQTENQDQNQDYYPSVSQAKIGDTYTTAQLLNYMIIDSDNNAALALSALIGSETLNTVYTDFKIPNGNNNLASDFLSVKMYSRLWRALYDGTYLSQNLSEQALSLLSQTTFNNGLVAGVPPGTIVSHKFGERTIKLVSSADSTEQPANEVRELHDCGIVYAPNDPYFVCIMTKGNSFAALQKIISDISGLVWKQATK